MAAKEHVPGQDELALLQRTPAVIAPGHTFESVTDSISSIVLTKRTTIGWFFGFALAFMNSNPELKHLFDQAVKHSWLAAEFIARLRGTKWFKHHSAAVRISAAVIRLFSGACQ